MFKWSYLVVVVLLLCFALLSDAARTAAQTAAVTATINNVNNILRASVGTPLICFLAFFGLVYQGLQNELPDDLANVQSMRIQLNVDGVDILFEINTNDFLAMHEYFFTKESLPEIKKLLKTVKGRAEVLGIMCKKLTNCGSVKHETDSTFQYGNDNHVQNTLYIAAVRNNLPLRFFNEDVTTDQLSDVTLLPLPPPIGAPVQNATNMKKNEAYADSVKPAFYVGSSSKPLTQNNVGPAIGENKKFGYGKLRQLREDWNDLPQGGKHALSITLKRRKITYK